MYNYYIMKKTRQHGLLLFSLVLLPLYFLVQPSMEYMRYFMGVFFILVAALKMLDWKGFIYAFSMYDIVAKQVKGYATVYPLIELLLGVGYLIAWQIPVLAGITLVLMVVGITGVAQNLLSKNPVQCACLGTRIKIPLTKITLAEDIIMGLMAAKILL